MNKLDLNKLKSEIENEKQKKGDVTTPNSAPKFVFLNGLLESLNTGRETQSTVLLKHVDNTVSKKKGDEIVYKNIPEVAPPHLQQNNINRPINNIDLNDRDDKFYMDLDKKRQETLADSIEKYVQNNVFNNGGANLYNKQTSDYTTSNGVQLSDKMKELIIEFLGDNLVPIIEDTIKNVIIEMYTIERIKKSLNDNKEIIQKIVYDYLKEIKAKSKQNGVK